MAKVIDVAFKSVTACLGLATLVFGANLVVNVTRGIAWHYSQPGNSVVESERGKISDVSLSEVGKDEEN